LHKLTKAEAEKLYDKLQIEYIIVKIMGDKFVIGNRLKDEWIAVLDTDKKILEFTSNLVKAQEYQLEEDAQMNLAEIQKSGYFSNLQIYIKNNNRAYRIDERG
jgi:hypothetical protein